MRNLSAVLRLSAFVVLTLLLVPPHLLMRALTGSVKTAAWWHRMACMVFNVRIRRMGAPLAGGARPTVYLCNHLSYLDIIVLGATLEGIFVAKSEVAGWPGFGFLAKTQNTIFITRKAHALGHGKKLIAAELQKGHNIILFGEGTSTDGRTVRPFKPGLLDVVFDGGVDALIQPVALVIESVGGEAPDAQAVRDRYAWWRPEDTLAPHLWNFAKAGGAVITVDCLAPLDPALFADRKMLARAATDHVAAVVAASRAA